MVGIRTPIRIHINPTGSSFGLILGSTVRFRCGGPSTLFRVERWLSIRILTGEFSLTTVHRWTRVLGLTRQKKKSDGRVRLDEEAGRYRGRGISQ